MTSETATRAAALYVPLLIAVLLSLSARGSRRRGAGILLACLWNVSSLLAVNLLAMKQGWWSFTVSSASFFGMPVDLYLGWLVLWGAIPALAFPSLPIIVVILAMAGVDVIFMPQLSPVVQPGPGWLTGEFVAVVTCLLPAQLLARWTERDRYLPARASMQAIIFAGIYIWLLPAITGVFGGRGWEAALNRPVWVQNIAFQILGLPMLLGVAALQEFCIRGRGTPLPFDPPRQMVSSGPYAYVANPMQLATVLFLGLLGAWLLNPAIAGAAIVGFVYSNGIAQWDESNDMKQRFGEAWLRYRSQVPAWWLQWRPWHASQCDPRWPKAKLYVAEFCGPCSEVRAWFEARQPIGLMLLAAEDHPARNLRRILYVSEDGHTEREGIAGVAAALQHIDLRWAVAGWIMALPVMCQFVQVLMDASGVAAPKEIQRRGLRTPTSDSPMQLQIREWRVASYFHESRGEADLCPFR